MQTQLFNFPKLSVYFSHGKKILVIALVYIKQSRLQNGFSLSYPAAWVESTIPSILSGLSVLSSLSSLVYFVLSVQFG